MNALLPLVPGFAPPSEDFTQDNSRDHFPWIPPFPIAANWLAYSLTNAITGPIISTYTSRSENEHTISNSVGHRLAKTSEIKLSNKTSLPFFEILSPNTATSPDTKSLPFTHYFAIFSLLQAAETIATSATGIIPAQFWPKAYLARLKSDLEFNSADKDVYAITSALSELIDYSWSALRSLFSTLQEVQDSATLLPVEAQADLRPLSAKNSSDNTSLASYTKDYVIFSIFYLLKNYILTSAYPKTDLHLYSELISDEGMVISSDRLGLAIADYLIEKREIALEKLLSSDNFLKEINTHTETFIKTIHASLPQKIHEILYLASPSDALYKQHSATDFFKDLLTAIAIAIPATGMGIHLLPKILDSKGLVFSVIMETSTNVIIHLTSRAATPLSDFMSEKSLAVMQALHSMLSAQQTPQAAPSAAMPHDQDILVHDICAGVDLSALMHDSCVPNARTAPDLQVFHHMYAQECPGVTAILVGVVESSGPATAA